TKSRCLRKGYEDWIPGGWAKGVPITVQQCVQCGAAYTSPRLQETFKHLAFEGAYPFYERARTDRLQATQAEIEAPFQTRVSDLEALFPEAGYVLDVGMGDGVFLAMMARRGWRVAGVDVEADVVAYAQRHWGIQEVQVADAERDALPQGPFDAITLWGMFQLAYEPTALLDKLRARLAPNGVLAIGVSNMEGLGSRLFRSHWRGLGLPRHLVHYTPDRLTRLLESCGFRVERVTFETPEWILRPSLQAALRLEGWPGRIIGKTIAMLWKPLGGSRLGDTFRIFARPEAVAPVPMPSPTSTPTEPNEGDVPPPGA
ncbi:MAG: class I SAM-dependent methyltransferase, partial [Firmicutes bacterium]|nr:class I SAM-dependent methyltransferase [Bacillota bacterium]